MPVSQPANPFLGGLTTLDGKFLGPGKIDNQGQDPFPFRDPVTGGGQPFMGNMNNMGGPNDKLTPIDPYKSTLLGGLSQDGQRFDSAQSAWDSLADWTRKSREVNPNTRDVIGTELYQGKKGFENFTNYFNQVNDPSYTAPQLQQLSAQGRPGGGMQSSLQTGSSQQNLQKALPGLFAQGGLAKLLGE